MRYKFIKNNRGGTTLLPIVLIVSATTLVLLSVFFSMGVTENKLVIRNENESCAFWLAEAAAEKFFFDQKEHKLGVLDTYADDYEMTNAEFNTIYSSLRAALGGSLSYQYVGNSTNGEVLTVKGTCKNTVATVEWTREEKNIFDFAYWDRGSPGLPGSNGMFQGVGILPARRMNITGDIYTGYPGINTNTNLQAGPWTSPLVIGSQNADVGGAAVTISGDISYFTAGNFPPGTVLNTVAGSLNSPTQVPLNGTVNHLEGSITPLTQVQGFDTDLYDKMLPDGYYHNKANLDLNNAPDPLYTTLDNFHNQAYGKNVDVLTLNLANYSGDWPSVIYGPKDRSLRIINASSLQDDIMIVSSRDIYIQGDFNSDNNDDTYRAKAAAIMTTQKITYLSEGWNDTPPSTDFADRQVPAGYVMSVNAAQVDGTPYICSKDWVVEDDPTLGWMYRESNKLITTTPPEWPPAVPQADPTLPGTIPSPCGGSFLEDWNTNAPSGGFNFVMEGLVIHLREAFMDESDLDNDGLNDDQSGNPGSAYRLGKPNDLKMDWVVARSYDPPSRNYSFSSLAVLPGSGIESLVPKTNTSRWVWRLVEIKEIPPVVPSI